MKALICITSLFSITSYSQLVNPIEINTRNMLNPIIYSGDFMLLSVDARAAGMGDQGIALDPDANSIHWNTAQMAFSEDKMGYSVSFYPWLNSLVNDIFVGAASGYGTFGENRKHALAGMFNWITLGELHTTDPFGNIIATYRPFDLRAVAGYAIQLSSRNSMGINAQFFYSDVIADTPFGDGSASSVSVDISYAYCNDEISIGGLSSILRWGINISNLGNKLKFFDTDTIGDFIPANFRVGVSYHVKFTTDHSMTLLGSTNKLLVPTSPVRNSSSEVVSGYDPIDVSVPGSWFRSFYDAPGTLWLHPDGSYELQKGSRLKEEMSEIQWSIGTEYKFKDYAAVRFGYFHETYRKGNRKFLTFGLGGGFKGFNLDVSYWLPFSNLSPLKHQMKFTLLYKLKRKDLSVR